MTATEPTTKILKRKPGPIKFVYVDEQGEKHNTAIDSPHSIVAIDASGNEQPITLDIAPHILKSLAVWALVKKADTFVRNSIDSEAPTNALELVAEAVTKIKSGKIAKAEGESKAGRKFDLEFWIGVFSSGVHANGKTFTEKMEADLRTKLGGMTSKDRHVFLSNWEKNPAFKVALLNAKAAQVTSKKSNEAAPSFDSLL